LKGSGAFSLTVVESAGTGGKEVLAKRQANAAVALMRMNQPDVAWTLLKHGPDPRVRSYIIHRLGSLGVDGAALIERLDVEPDVSTRRALILSLGAFEADQLPAATKTALTQRLLQIYEQDPDAGMHGAAGWLLRHWGHAAQLAALNAKLATTEAQL